MTEEKIKFCKDCKFYEEGKCNCPKNLFLDLTDGKYSRRWTSCSLHRESGLIEAIITKCCGRKGRWFQKKGKMIDEHKTWELIERTKGKEDICSLSDFNPIEKAKKEIIQEVKKIIDKLKYKFDFGREIVYVKEFNQELAKLEEKQE